MKTFRGFINKKYNSGYKFKDCFSSSSFAMTGKGHTSLRGTKQSIKWELFILNPLIVIAFLLFNLNSLGYSKTSFRSDSLLNEFNKAKTDSMRIHFLLKISEKFRHENSDSSYSYAQKALDFSLKIKNRSGVSQAYSYLGTMNNDIGNYNLAIEFFRKSLRISEVLKNNQNIISSYNGIGIAYAYKGNYPQSLNYFQKSLKLSIEINDTVQTCYSYNNLGIIHNNQGNFSLAIEYYNKSLNLSQLLKDKESIARNYTNIGVIYHEQKKYPLAMEYYQKALSLSQETGNLLELSNSYTNIALIQVSMKLYDEAVVNYKKSISIDEQLGDKQALCRTLGNISALYTENNQYNLAIDYGKKSLDIANQIQSLEDIKNAYNYISMAYEKSGKIKESFEYFKLYISSKDSLFSSEKNKQLAQMEAQYQNEKKQKEIEILNKDKAIQKTEIQKQTTQKYALLGGFALMLLLSIVIYKSYRDKKRANIQLKLMNEEISFQKHEIEEKNEELNQQNEEIRTQRDEIEAQRDLVTTQKNHIEEIHREVSQSIDYAKKIQASILPDETMLNDFLSDHFVLFKPKDKVSGDFYWWTHIEGQTVIAVADCTGHGVPGAFMSMLGSSFLREIVQKEYMTNPDIILKRLRKEIIKSLNQKGVFGEQKDGMDMALISINHETKKIQFAGANNPLYIVSYSHFTGLDFDKANGEQVSQNRTLKELKGDKMPVAIYENMGAFTNQEFQAQLGDVLYMMSDGFEDQFGGPKGKKFLSKRLKELLLSISHESMENQKNILNQSLSDWMFPDSEKYEQTDDISIMGIRI